MAIKKVKWVEIGRILAILLDAIAGALDRICERYEKKEGVVQPETPEETGLRKKLQEEYTEA